MQDNRTTNIPDNPDTLSAPIKPMTRRKRIVQILLISTGLVIGLPALLLGGLLGLAMLYSSPPMINLDNEKADIAKYLYTKYGETFTIDNVTGKGPQILGESKSILADAYPKGDKSIKVSIRKTLETSPVYYDDYLTHVWSAQAKTLLAERIKNTFTIPPIVKSEVIPSYQFNNEYKLGRVMSLEEALRVVPDKVSHQVDLTAGSNGTTEEHSRKLYDLKEYLTTAYKGAQSNLTYNFIRDDSTYTCFLSGFTLQFIESDRQLYGCWYVSKGVKAPYAQSNPVKEIDGEALPIIMHPGDATIKKVENNTSSPRSFTITKDNLTAKVEIFNIGFGDKINETKQQFAVDQVNELPVGNKMTTTTLTPNQHVSVGASRYRRDMNTDKRVIHYILAYKTFTIRVSAETYNATTGLDVRDKEFWLYNFINDFKPVDGFKET